MSGIIYEKYASNYACFSPIRINRVHISIQLIKNLNVPFKYLQETNEEIVLSAIQRYNYRFEQKA